MDRKQNLNKPNSAAPQATPAATEESPNKIWARDVFGRPIAVGDVLLGIQSKSIYQVNAWKEVERVLDSGSRLGVANSASYDMISCEGSIICSVIFNARDPGSTKPRGQTFNFTKLHRKFPHKVWDNIDVGAISLNLFRLDHDASEYRNMFDPSSWSPSIAQGMRYVYYGISNKNGQAWWDKHVPYNEEIEQAFECPNVGLSYPFTKLSTYS